MNTIEQLNQIVAGKTYPAYVKVTEAKHPVIEFHLNSFYVGMYCAIHVNGNVAMQTGDHNNTRFVGKLKEDILAALARGATVEIGSIRPCQLEIPK